MTSNESDMEIDGTPPELRAEAQLALNNLLPAKSKERYTTCYESFLKWRADKNAHSFSETVFLAYFTEMAQSKKPSSLWAMYSMMKATMQLKHNIDMQSFSNLRAWLKRNSAGYKAKKARIFSSENIETFLNCAPDDTYLAIKVAMILGITGACRGLELSMITTKDIEFQGDIIVIQLRDTKTKIDRSFVVRDEFKNIFQKYYDLRPKDTITDRLFLNYKNSKCTKQVIGRHTIASMPKKIATFLNLDDPHLYTGHSFRRSSATLLADSGADLLALKRHGGWKSDKVAEGYIEDSIGNKDKISKNITENIKLRGSTNTENQYNSSHQNYESLYENLQPGCSKDPPGFIRQNVKQPPSIQVQPSSSSTYCQVQNLTDCPQPSLYESNPQPPPSHQDVGNSEQSTAHIVPSQAGSSTDIQQTNISVPGKTIKISISNCPNITGFNDSRLDSLDLYGAGYKP